MGLSLRTKERLIEIWLKDGRNERVRANVSNKLRQLLGLDPESVTLYYKEHQKSIKDQSTMKNAEGFKFMKVDQHGSSHHQGRGHYNNSAGAKYQQQNFGGNGQQPMSRHQHQQQLSQSNTGPHRQNYQGHQGNGDSGFEGGSFRKNSNQLGGGNQNGDSSAQDKPFSHLGANYPGEQRVYRVKAPSHI